jgi:hypothetical protein
MDGKTDGLNLKEIVSRTQVMKLEVAAIIGCGVKLESCFCQHRHLGCGDLGLIFVDNGSLKPGGNLSINAKGTKDR